MCERLFKLVSASKEICTWLSFKDISDVTLQLADLKPDLCHSNTRKSMSFSNDYIPLWEYHISPVNLDIFKNLSILEFGHTDFKGGVVPEEKYATNLSMMVESFEEELDQVRSSHDFQDGMIPCLIQSLISTESVD